MRLPARDDSAFSLREERDILREQLRQILDAHGQGLDERLAYSIAIGVTKQEAAVLSLLVRRGIVSTEQFRTLVSKGEGIDSNVLTTLVCRIRRRLSPLGITILTSWGSGYYMNLACRQALQKIVDDWRAQVGHPDPVIQTTIANARMSVSHHG